jgi:hypothetical protein
MLETITLTSDADGYATLTVFMGYAITNNYELIIADGDNMSLKADAEMNITKPGLSVDSDMRFYFGGIITPEWNSAAKEYRYKAVAVNFISDMSFSDRFTVMFNIVARISGYVYVESGFSLSSNITLETTSGELVFQGENSFSMYVEIGAGLSYAGLLSGEIWVRADGTVTFSYGDSNGVETSFVKLNSEQSSEYGLWFSFIPIMVIVVS